MGVRFPQPPQGWTALRWEVGVVFVGIVLALSAQQLADTLYWRGQAAQAKRNIETELLQHERDSYERLAVQRCLKGQLAALMSQLSITDSNWRAMPMTINMIGLSPATQAAIRVFPVAYRAPIRLWRDDAFETARANGALNYLSDKTVAHYAEIYTRGRSSVALQDREAEAASQLSVLAYDGRLDATARMRLIAALSVVDDANSRLENNARQALDELRLALRDVPRETRAAAVAERIEGQQEFRGSCVLPVTFKL